MGRRTDGDGGEPGGGDQQGREQLHQTQEGELVAQEEHHEDLG